MSTGRMEAFSDGVIAILITIMVLELHVPEGTTWRALSPGIPVFLAYLLSFVYLGIYWVNHHHLLQAAERVNGGVLWANLHLLFWLSLVPFATEWMGEHHEAMAPTALYGTVLFCAGVAYTILQSVLIRAQGPHSKMSTALGTNAKGFASVALNAAAVGCAFYNPAISDALFITVALMWLVPNRRVEQLVKTA